MPSEGTLPLRCAIDFLPYRYIIAGHREDNERKIADTCAVFRLLIRRGANVNTPSVGFGDQDNAKTPLLELCRRVQEFALIRCLIEEGADVKVSDKRGYTPLHS